MTYLLAKYTVLFLLTALLGFVLGYWFSRRKFVDVSESYEDLRKANARSDASQWDRLWKQLDSIPAPKETDLTPVHEQLTGITTAVSSLPRPEPVSFASVESRLDSLQESIRGIPAPPQPKDPDLRPLIERLDNLERDVKEIPTVETHAPVDLAPVTSQLSSIEQRFSAIPQPQSVDLAPIDRRLTAIEAQLGNLGTRLATPAPKERAPRRTAPREPRILSAALHGKKDDLKLISGVGPKLERLLNQNGVYYFWQVAEWSPRDIDIIDERLDVFKGRITRDDWVSQARQLRRKPGAASMPAE